MKSSKTDHNPKTQEKVQDAAQDKTGLGVHTRGVSLPSASQGRNSGSAPDNDRATVRHLWQSPWTTWIGFRYLKSKKNSRFLSFITLLSMGGVGLGVTAMIVVLSVMDGFESELKKRMSSSDLHILIQPESDLPGFDSGFVPATVLPPAKISELKEKSAGKIENFWPVVSTEAILKSGKKVMGVVLKGVDPNRLEHLKTQMVEYSETQLLAERDGAEAVQLPALYMGQELAFQMEIIPGDQVTLISPLEVEGPMDGIPRLKRYVIQGIYKSGHPEQELHTLFASESAVRSFLRKNTGVTQWELAVKDFSDAPSVAKILRGQLPGFRIQDWIELNSHLFASLKLERASMFVILAFIIIVASFNIVTTLTLMVLEKKKEISILKAMGARNGQVGAIFLAEGVFIGTLGVGGGTLLGFVICVLLKRYEFIEMPDIYYDRTLPVTFNGSYYAIIAVVAVVIVLGACLYPSKRAAKLNPLDGIRFG